MNILNIGFENRQKQLVTLADYKAQYYLVINTASKCGLTPQFDGLEALNQEFKNQGLKLLGFPCGQFADQEFNDSEQAHEFCKLNYGVTFDLMDKIDVNGPHAAPLFTELKAQMPDDESPEIKWNFTKFLIDNQGNVIKRFGPKEEPQVIKSYLDNIL